jgi:hypothetical protein
MKSLLERLRERKKTRSYEPGGARKARSRDLLRLVPYGHLVFSFLILNLSWLLLFQRLTAAVNRKGKEIINGQRPALDKR